MANFILWGMWLFAFYYSFKAFTIDIPSMALGAVFTILAILFLTSRDE